jgi:hypothetical protein
MEVMGEGKLLENFRKSKGKNPEDIENLPLSVSASSPVNSSTRILHSQEGLGTPPQPPARGAGQALFTRAQAQGREVGGGGWANRA